MIIYKNNDYFSVRIYDLNHKICPATVQNNYDFTHFIPGKIAILI